MDLLSTSALFSQFLDERRYLQNVTASTIEWYEKNNAGKIPESDGLLSGGLPCVVDAWYVLLDRWGTMSFEQVLQPAIELAEKGFPLGESSADDIASTTKIRSIQPQRRFISPAGSRQRQETSSAIPIWQTRSENWLNQRRPTKPKEGTRRSRLLATVSTREISPENSRRSLRPTADCFASRTLPNIQLKLRRPSQSIIAVIGSIRIRLRVRVLQN